MADPVVHFFSENDEVAYVTKAIVEEDTLHTKIPDVLLTLDKTIYGCVFCNDSEGQQSRYFFRIAIGARPKPTTYIDPDKDYKDYYDVMEVLAACKEYEKAISLIYEDIKSYTQRAENAAIKAEDAVADLDQKIIDVNQLLSEAQSSANQATELINNYSILINNAISDAGTRVDEYVTQMVNATNAANNAAADATEAAQLAREAAEQAGLERANAPKQWGVRFPSYRSGSSPDGVRLKDAIGLVAEVGTDISADVRNDFDNLKPWQTYRVNGDWKDGAFHVTAKEGDPTFDTKTKNTYALRNLFYYKIVTTPEYFEIWISDQLIPGYKVPKRFLKSDGTILQEYYYPCYKAGYEDSYNGDRTPVTKSGRRIATGGVAADFQEWVKDNLYSSSNRYHIETLADRQINELLFMVEFATLNSQSIMRGASCMGRGYSLDYDDVDWDEQDFQAKEDSENCVILPKIAGKEFMVGQRIKIGTSELGNNITSDAIVTSIEDYNGNTKISFLDEIAEKNGITVHVKTGHWISSDTYYTGGTDTVKTPSGSPVSNTNGKYQCRYRYVEDLWGNQWSVMGDLYAHAGSLYYSTTPWKANIYSPEESYELLDTTFDLNAKHFIYKMLPDKNHSDLLFPSSISEEIEEYSPSKDTYFCDLFLGKFYFYASDVRDGSKKLFGTQAKKDNSYRLVCKGGGITDRDSAGIFSTNCGVPREYISCNFGCRLSYSL